MEPITVQNRVVTAADLEWIRGLISNNPTWHRSKLSIFICEHWNWRNQAGLLKDMAARTFLLKLERRGLLVLPKRKVENRNRKRSVFSIELDLNWQPPASIEGGLAHLQPLVVELVQAKPQRLIFRDLLSRHHYLSYHRPVGENLQYLIRDNQHRVLACVLFGAAAWKCAPRDQWIGWDIQQRIAGLPFIANNMRFLILPWVRVPNLASWILSQVARRVSDDWQKKYGHPIWLLETFVDLERFTGACYRASNWRCLGQTQGRSRNDRFHEHNQPIRSIYAFALHKKFRQHLTSTYGQTIA